MVRRFGGATFMCFKDLTLVPIQTKMIDADLITPQEEAWLDAYHKQVRVCVCVCVRLHLI
jgi:Xaa-Pro aminopeptidase